MNQKDMELMKRYIYQVTRRIPAAQRHEIGLELQELISDMAETSDSMESVLMRLGDPAELAKKYQDASHHLIGPEYYDTYLWFLKVVMICALIPVLATGVFEFVRESSLTAMGDVIRNCIVSGMGVFGSITIMFAVMERQKIKFDLKAQAQWSVNDLGDNFSGGRKAWSPVNLAPLPHKKAMISRGDSIVSIIFIVLFCCFLIFFPHFLSTVPMEDGLFITAPLFNMKHWNIILPLLVLSMLLCLADEVIKLIHGHYCTLVMISNIVCGGFQILICFILTKILHFLNPDFILQVQLQLGEPASDFGNALAQMNGDVLNSILFAFICVVTVIEIGVTVYKTKRYGYQQNALS